MATKKTEQISLIESFAEFKETKNLDRATLVNVLEDTFRRAIATLFGSDENYNVIVNPDKGDFEIYRDREVVADGEVIDDNKQIALSEAQKIVDDIEIGEDVTESIDFATFGRRAILTLRQTLASRIIELDNENLFNDYKDKVGQLITGEVHSAWKRETLIVDENGNDLILTKDNQIPGDFFRKGDVIKAVVSKVDNSNSNTKIYVSRTSPVFLQRLLENEVPEMIDGLVTIKKISRLPGKRAKIAVESLDDRIDPVGACVGVKGSRVNGIVRELRGENLDVIPYASDPSLFISRCLQPAKIKNITLGEKTMYNKTTREDEIVPTAEVLLDPEEVSKAIGNNGTNIKLACMITGYDIEVFRNTEGMANEEEEVERDIILDEFDDVIDPWIIKELKKAGMRTAQHVLDTPVAIIAEQADLEEEQAEEVVNIIRNELGIDDYEEDEEEVNEEEIVDEQEILEEGLADEVVTEE